MMTRFWLCSLILVAWPCVAWADALIVPGCGRRARPGPPMVPTLTLAGEAIRGLPWRFALISLGRSNHGEEEAIELIPLPGWSHEFRGRGTYRLLALPRRKGAVRPLTGGEWLSSEDARRSALFSFEFSPSADGRGGRERFHLEVTRFGPEGIELEASVRARAGRSRSSLLWLLPLVTILASRALAKINERRSAGVASVA